ncbi:hypothetical protein CWC20_06090 [Pseudoalteromonas aurantia]|uniref:Uncharacterized protein n=1 Tax=Pseudoalteromonas aurantia TaxID=43654 RepID=A0ABY2VZZ3_9GAMM|nr:hypothetical protein CWC20_06090 [Pseudoalteromonas aurantia]
MTSIIRDDGFLNESSLKNGFLLKREPSGVKFSSQGELGEGELGEGELGEGELGEGELGEGELGEVTQNEKRDFWTMSEPTKQLSSILFLGFICASI